MRKRSRKKTIRKITVPDLSGLTRSQAQSTLSSLGLIYSESTTNTSNLSLSNTIYSQETSQGSTAVFGDSIPFVYYNYVLSLVHAIFSIYLIVSSVENTVFFCNSYGNSLH